MTEAVSDFYAQYRPTEEAAFERIALKERLAGWLLRGFRPTTRELRYSTTDLRRVSRGLAPVDLHERALRTLELKLMYLELGG